MRERRDIVELYRRGQAAVLATLTNVDGSSYRRAGARLLIAADGTTAGAISGGCLEAEVVRRAQWLVRNGAVVEQYSTVFDDTAEVPYGLGCGGTVRVLLEPAGTPEFVALMEALAQSLEGVVHRVSTILPAPTVPTLRRSIVDSQGQVIFATVDRWEPEESERFEETLLPPQRLVVFGAGDDAQPLVAMAALLGWTVVVIDGRVQWARAERFPQAQRVVATSSLESLAIETTDAVIVMTHSYEQDKAWLAAVLPRQPRYIGLLGSKHRSALLVAEVAALLDWPIDRACAGVFSPVGLDLGGDGADAIALAAVAEIQAFVEGKLGHSRRLTPAVVEEQLQQGGASRYLQTQCAV